MDITIERDIVFRQARVGWRGGAGPLATVDLKLDAYLPAAPPRSPAPALVMAFGGAFHRGSKEDDSFTDGNGRSTAVAAYCRRFAALGMPSFAVSYRLAQSDPEPGRPILGAPDRIPMSRINPVRNELGLPPIEPRAMAAIMEAAFDDVAAAVDFVRASATRFGVDPARIVLGGFSAGGRAAMYGAYGHRLPVAGVVALSGPLVPADAAAFLAKGGPPLPPLLMVSGERDLDYVCSFSPELDRLFRAAGQPVEWTLLAGASHFYPAEAKGPDGRAVIDVMRAAIERWVGPLAVT